MAQQPPNLKAERELFAMGAQLVLACDEVGRGALAGPVSVGMVAITPDVRRMPAGLRDSKLLAEPKREALAPRAAAWVAGWAVGEASAAEIDEHGIMACLGLAGRRAWDQLVTMIEVAHGAPLLLDGNYDWLSTAIEHRARVVTRIKADRDCASVSAASVLAKVHRDRGMRALQARHPVYGWDENKGYSTAAHFAALREHGPTEFHRHTWLHGKAAPTQVALFDA
ncbi:MAG TPA: ribonuclease HII [Candidatus Lumbricidophila sp.]|nr:ribonuclease HII [Candidatus Lumbricidophila sp.]